MLKFIICSSLISLGCGFNFFGVVVIRDNILFVVGVFRVLLELFPHDVQPFRSFEFGVVNLYFGFTFFTVGLECCLVSSLRMPLVGTIQNFKSLLHSVGDFEPFEISVGVFHFEVLFLFVPERFLELLNEGLLLSPLYFGLGQLLLCKLLFLFFSINECVPIAAISASSCSTNYLSFLLRYSSSCLLAYFCC